MAEDLFQTTEIVGINNQQKKRLTISGFESEDLWLTSIQGEVSPNFQLMYSLGVDVFINAFNTRMGTFMLGGIYIPETCTTKGNGGVPPFISFYKSHNINERVPAKIAFDGITIKGWIVKMMIKEYTQNNIDGHEFSIQFLGRLREIEKNR
jgi:hypothetical protein